MPTGIDPIATAVAAGRRGIPRAYGDRPRTLVNGFSATEDSPCLRG